jgi:F-type H+-transporting ATPase subunit b
MNRNISRILIAGSVLFIPAIAAASGGGEEHGPTVMDWVYKILNFAILVGVLYVFGWKMIRTHLKQRRDLIEKSITEAREAKVLAAKALAEVEERLKLKDKEVADIIAAAQESGAREKARIIAESEQLKAKLLEQAKTNIDFEVKKAKEAIQAEAVEQALKIAEEKIKARMTPQEQERLVKESITLIEGRN